MYDEVLKSNTYTVIKNMRRLVHRLPTEDRIFSNYETKLPTKALW